MGRREGWGRWIWGFVYWGLIEADDECVGGDLGYLFQAETGDGGSEARDVGEAGEGGGGVVAGGDGVVGGPGGEVVVNM